MLFIILSLVYFYWLTLPPHPPQVVCKKYRNFDIPAELKGLTRYLNNAYEQDEFRYTCPNDSEILGAYQSVAKYLNQNLQKKRWVQKR